MNKKRCAAAVAMGLVVLAGTPARAAPPYEVLHAFMNVRNPNGPLVQGSDGWLYGTTERGGPYDDGTIFKVSADGTSFSVVHTFVDYNGARPSGGLIRGSDGALYGTTTLGETVYRLSADGSSFSVLQILGGQPIAGVIQGRDGALYGTTSGGGTYGGGTVFKVSSDGSSFTVLHHFDDPASGNPVAALVQASDGLLYGTTTGSWYGRGTVFKIAPDGSSFAVIHSFEPQIQPIHVNGLVEGPYGALYGTTALGEGLGTVFRISSDGSSFSVIHSFDGENGFAPYAALITGLDGALYGTTSDVAFSTVTGRGTVFKVLPDGSGFSVLHRFAPTDGIRPLAALTQGSDGTLYGTTSVGGGRSAVGTAFRLSPTGSSFSVLHRFDRDDGLHPSAALTQGVDGALYGTTMLGGTSDAGTVFKLSAGGSPLTTLHSFAKSGSGGAFPAAALVQGVDGSLYGTTQSGGAYDAGTVFKVAADGSSYSVIHDFDFVDGAGPLAALIRGADGLLYGTTSFGNLTAAAGTVFKLATDGSSFSVIHRFSGPDGAGPQAALLQGQDGALYGTAYSGGYGTVYKLSTDGSSFVVLHTFDGTNGGVPYAALIQGPDGTLYGTTPRENGGIVYKLSPAGSNFSVLHRFTGDDGSEPYASLVQASDGALYGTTSAGGGFGAGTAFRMTADGSSFRVLHTFESTGGRDQRISALLQGQDGALYGTAQEGGPNGGGVVFRINLASEDSRTTTSLTSSSRQPSPSYSVVGEPVTFTATVASAGGEPTGTVTFRDLTARLGSSALGTRGAAFTTSALADGTHYITAEYGGDARFQPSTSFVLRHLVGGRASVSINDVVVAEGNGGVTRGHFTVSLSVALGVPVTVAYATADGTALGGDYTAVSGTLTFPPGSASQTVAVPIVGDTVAESDETFTVTLAAPVNAILGRATGTGTIADDDGPSLLPALTVDDRAVAEGAAVNAAFRVWLSEPTSQTVTVDYATAGGTADAPGDYEFATGTLTFTPGRTNQTVIVPIVTDMTAEGGETFYLNLASATNARIGDGQGTGSIADAPPALRVAMYRAYNAKTDYHFFTTDQASKEFAVGVLGFRDESTPIPFYVANTQEPGSVPLFRMYNPNLGRHYYTAGVGDREFLLSIGMTYEKDEGFIHPTQAAGTTELFRLYNTNSGTHLFTADSTQKDTILALFPGVWVPNASVGYVFPAP